MPQTLENFAKMFSAGMAFVVNSGGAITAAANKDVGGAAGMAGDAVGAYADYLSAVNDFWDNDYPPEVGNNLTQTEAGVQNSGNYATAAASTGLQTNVDPNQVAGAVWSYSDYPLMTSTGLTMRALQAWVYAVNPMFSFRTYPYPGFRFNCQFANIENDSEVQIPAVTVDWSGAGADEPLYDFLVRQVPDVDWILDYPSVGYVGALPVSPNKVGVICEYGPQEWDFIRHYRYIPSSGGDKRSTLGDFCNMMSLIPVQFPP